MAYGSSTWNKSIQAKNYLYTGYDAAGFLHGSNSAEGLANILNGYDSQIGSQWISNMMDDIHNREQAASERQMEFQQTSSAATMAYNAVEAQKNRDWQTWMSDTAHQRELADLRAAGLNPILSANNGAAVGSGSVASTSPVNGSRAEVDASLATSMIGLINNSLTNAANVAQTKMSTLASMANAMTTADATKTAAALNSAASRYGSELISAATRYSADTSYKNAMRSYLASVYGTNMQKTIEQMRQQYNNLHPTTMFQGLGTVLTSLVGLLGIDLPWHDYTRTY